MLTAPATPSIDDRPRSRRAPAAALGLLAVLAAGCATAPLKGEEVIWPPPPDVGRIKYVQTLQQESDLGSGFWQDLLRSLSPARTAEVVFNPTGLALSPDEKRLYVVSGTRGSVLEFDFDKRRTRLLATAEGARPVRPFGIAADGEGLLYVTDSASAAIWVYDANGEPVRKIQGPKVERPTGVAVDRKRQLLFVVEGGAKDSGHHAVEVFSLKGEHVRTIGGRGAAPGLLYFPVGVAVDSADGTIWVTDALNFRVQHFDAEGAVLGTFGQIGDGVGSFAKPKGLALDAFGNVHVVDGEHAGVQVFNQKGQLLLAYGGKLSRLEFFSLPGPIAIDSKNRIFIADYAAGKVNVYQLINTTKDDSTAPPAPATPPAPQP